MGKLVKLILGNWYFPELKSLSISEFRCEAAYAARWFEKAEAPLEPVPSGRYRPWLVVPTGEMAPPLRDGGDRSGVRHWLEAYCWNEVITTAVPALSNEPRTTPHFV